MTNPDQEKLEYIKKTVANHYGFDVNVYDLDSSKRKTLKVKQVAIYFCKKYTSISLKKIGVNFNGYGHSMILHCIKVINNSMSTDKEFRLEMEKLNDVILALINQLQKND